MEQKKQESWWHRITRKYRLSVMHEDTLSESWHVRLSWISVFTAFTLMFLLTVALLSVLIIYTPIRQILPGYSEDLRQGLVENTARVDSLQTTMEVQQRYLDVLKGVMSGEVSTDTVQPLDSLEAVMREQLLEAKNEATEEFLAQYENKERSSLQLFDIQETTPVYTFFRPAHGVILQGYDPQNSVYGISLRTADNENLTAVLAGVVVHIDYEIDNSYTIILQHATYLSVYRHAQRVLKHVGESVKAGESIAIAQAEPIFYFELWQNGHSINPEEVIAF
ncbi:MAG: M23 family metallopeptidase [Paludibacteraceae bacterium]|nr:M23 family metallopeptidase [Paludibacteraceae bacterium]